MTENKIKYISELNPDSPQSESYVRDGIKDITNIKKALRASFLGCKGPVLIHAEMTDRSTSKKIILQAPLIQMGYEYVTSSLSDNTIIVFKSNIQNDQGVKLSFGDRNMNVMDARGAWLEANAIRKNSVNILIYYANTCFLLGYVNRAKNKIPQPEEANKNKLLSNNGSDFIWSEPPKALPNLTGNQDKFLRVKNQDGSLAATWSDLPKPPKALPNLTGNQGKFLRVKNQDGSLAATWSDLPKPPKALPDLAGNQGKALHVIENPVTSILEVSWEAVQEALPPLDGQIGKALIVTEATDSHQLKASWENVEGELPGLTDNQDKFLRVVQTSAGSLGIAWETVPAELPPIDGKRGLILQVVLGDDQKEKTEWRSIGRELPDYRSSVDKLLSVEAVGEHMRLAWVDPPSGLPNMSGQKGKALHVIDHAGTLEAGWVEVAEILPPISGEKDKALRVVEDLETHQLKVAWKGVPEALPAIDGQEGKALLVIKDPASQHLKVAWENVAGELPALNGHEGQYLRVSKTDAETLGIGWEDIKGNELPAINESKNGKFLRVKKDGNNQLSLVWQRATPDIKGDDEGRVLAVSGGEQTWQDPPQTPPSIALGYF